MKNKSTSKIFLVIISILLAVLFLNCFSNYQKKVSVKGIYTQKYIFNGAIKAGFVNQKDLDKITFLLLDTNRLDLESINDIAKMSNLIQIDIIDTNEQASVQSEKILHSLNSFNIAKNIQSININTNHNLDLSNCLNNFESLHGLTILHQPITYDKKGDIVNGNFLNVSLPTHPNINIETLTINGFSIDNLMVLENYKNLTNLNLILDKRRKQDFPAEILANKALITLNLDNFKIKNDEILETLKQLKYIQLANVTINSLSWLYSLEHLSEITLVNITADTSFITQKKFPNAIITIIN